MAGAGLAAEVRLADISGVGGAMFATLVVLSALNAPVALGLLISVEPLIDMRCTAVNVSGSMTAGTVTSKLRQTDLAVFTAAECRRFLRHQKHSGYRRVPLRLRQEDAKNVAKEENGVRVGLGGALMGIGKGNKKLNVAAIKVARAIGPIHFSDGDKQCEPMDVLKQLTSNYLRLKLGRRRLGQLARPLTVDEAEQHLGIGTAVHDLLV